jgi:hypothetical protein
VFYLEARYQMTLVIIVFTYIILMSNFSVGEIASLRMETVPGKHCRTVFNISDIIRVHPEPSFLLPSTLQIHRYTPHLLHLSS